MEETQKPLQTIGNYGFAGSEKFILHAISDDEKKTLCGLTLSKLRGDWEWSDSQVIGCLRCKKKYKFCSCAMPKPRWKESSAWYCDDCKKPMPPANV